MISALGPSRRDSAISAEGPGRVDELLVPPRDPSRQDGSLPLSRYQHRTVYLRYRSEFPRRDPTAELELPPRRPKCGDERGWWRLRSLHGHLALHYQICPPERQERIVEQSAADVGSRAKGNAAEDPERFVRQPVRQKVRSDYSNPPRASLVGDEL